MLVQVNTDGSVDHGAIASQAEATVEAALSRFGERITRVEVHLSDSNSHKAGADDKRCMMEARIAGRAPVAVSHNAPAFGPAISGAAEKLRRALESALGRAGQH